MVLLIDNFDSFVFNIARYLEELDEDVHVVRRDALDLESIRTRPPSHIVLSPGPCTPKEARGSIDVIRLFGDRIPILGVCLGHQCLGVATGGRVIRAARPMHGRVSEATHRATRLFAGLPSPLRVTRYHSLVVDPEAVGTHMEVTAWTAEGEVMAFEHRTKPLWGVQFHPEAAMTEGGHRLLANFLALGRRGTASDVRVPVRNCPELPEMTQITYSP